ncbi:MAG TPA: hypothetical protein VFM02_01530 [Candidatus Paceibacterota bacterium]|nr:hypothetical protein [Candidatus Paceibacterota bacterium]
MSPRTWREGDCIRIEFFFSPGISMLAVEVIIARVEHRPEKMVFHFTPSPMIPKGIQFVAWYPNTGEWEYSPVPHTVLQVVKKVRYLGKPGDKEEKNERQAPATFRY